MDTTAESPETWGATREESPQEWGAKPDAESPKEWGATLEEPALDEAKIREAIGVLGPVPHDALERAAQNWQVGGMSTAPVNTTDFDRPTVKMWPELSDEEMKTLRAASPEEQRSAAAANSMAKSLNSLTSPNNLGLLAATMGFSSAPVLGRAMALGFTAYMAKNAGQSAVELAKEYRKPEADRDPQKIGRLMGEGGLDGFMALMGAAGLRGKATPAERVAGLLEKEVGKTELGPVEPAAIAGGRPVVDGEQVPGEVPAAVQTSEPVAVPEPAAAPVVEAADEMSPAPAPAGDASAPVPEEEAAPAPAEEPELEALSVGPGAASPVAGEIGGPQSQMGQLTDLVGRFTPEQQPIGDRFRFAERLSDAVTDGQTAAVKALGRVQAGAATLRDALTKLPPFTEFKRTLGEWLGQNQKADLEAHNFVKAIEKQVPNRLTRVAMTNWIQADGDLSVLRQRAEASKGSLKRGYEAALELKPEEQMLARHVSQYFDARLQEGVESGLLGAGVENYVNQLWKRENPITKELKATVQSGLLTPDFKSARRRVFDSYFTGEQAGFTPATKDVGRLVAIYDQSFNRSTLSRAFLKQLTKAKASDGRPLASVTGNGVPVPREAPEAILVRPTAKPEAILDYKTVDHPAMRGWKWVAAGEGGAPVMVQGDLVVHPEIYKHVRNALGTSALRQVPVLKEFGRLQSIQKATAFSLSSFHAVTEGVHAVAHGVNPFKPVELDLTNPVQMNLVKRGLQIAHYDAWQDFQDGFKGGGPLIDKLPVVGPLQQAFTEWLFHRYIPRLKMTMALDAFDRNLKRYRSQVHSGKVSADQIAELTARQGNAAFGELNYKYMGRNPTLQHAFRTFLIAPDFLEARARFLGQAIKPYGAEQLRALGVIGAGSYMAARILNKTLDDDYHFEKPFSVIALGHEYMLRSVPSDAWEAVTDFRRFAMNRIALGVHAGVEYLTGRDYRGVPVDAKQQVKDILAAFQPMSTRLPKDDEKWWQMALNAAGVRNKPYDAQMQVRDMADRWLKAKGTPRPPIAYPESAYRSLRVALHNADDNAARLELAKLRAAGHSPKQISEAIDRFAKNKFTGSTANEPKFVASLNQHQREVYNKALRERQAVQVRFHALSGTLVTSTRR